MSRATEIADRQRVRTTDAAVGYGQPGEARRQLLYELVSGASGLALAVFMWGHMMFVASILLGTRSFDWLADTLEVTYVAQPTVLIIFAIFLIHAAFAARKIPAQLRERRQFYALARELRSGPSGWREGLSHETLKPHIESWLWIWQVRTGMLMLVLGGFHLVLMTMDIFTPLWGERAGIEAATSMARTSAGLVWMYAVLLLCVEFHAGVGLYRLAAKWGLGTRLRRTTLQRFERFLFWFFIGLGLLVLIVLAEWLPPPLAFLVGGEP